MPIELQQLLLNIFTHALPVHLNSKYSVLQEIKGHLFNRDFDRAFGNDDFREVYAARWSPTRALAYLHIFCNIPSLPVSLLSNLHRLSVTPKEVATIPHVSNDSANSHQKTAVTQKSEVKPSRIVCFGGGAGAEIVALATYMHYFNGLTQNLPSLENGSFAKFDITAIDIADWSSLVHQLHTGIVTRPPLSRYPSPSAKTANGALLKSNSFSLNFVRRDILDTKKDVMAAWLENASLVTIMFTLNELYSASLGSTTGLLLSLTDVLAPGALLLVVDSPGSYSTVNLGKASKTAVESGEKKYPMQWLLDHTILETACTGRGGKGSEGRQWEKLESHDSRWFRLPEGLNHPIDLEDMRYQLHLYRRTETS